jgi:uncharacterized protein (DUF952 family)
MNNFPLVAYKVLTSAEMDWLLADGSCAGSPVDLADGYIHLSTAEQVQGTLEKHFAGQSGLHIAIVDLRALGDAVLWESSRGGQMFPHAYCALPLSAVLAHGPLERNGDGEVVLPGG